MDDNHTEDYALTRERKVGFVFLLIFAILTVGLGALQLRNTVYGPYAARVVRNTPAQANLLVDETTRLQQIDTDQDGLSDYEEIYFYETSAYIPDTDSDGIADQLEIEQGTDPLCPEGQACADEADLPDFKQETIETQFGNVPTAAELLGIATASGTAAAGANLDLNALVNDPAALRELLLKSGSISATELEQISDAELLELAASLL